VIDGRERVEAGQPEVPQWVVECLDDTRDFASLVSQMPYREGSWIAVPCRDDFVAVS
jgi:hypothetical protein